MPFPSLSKLVEKSLKIVQKLFKKVSPIEETFSSNSHTLVKYEINEKVIEMLSRLEMHTKPVKKGSVFPKVVLVILSIFVLASLATALYFKNDIVIDKPEEDLGEKVVVVLPNGKEVYTYENLIVSENGKLYYKGDRSSIDLTGGIVRFEEWK